MTRIEIYDTTLRDGAQGEGVNFSLVDKLKIARKLDALGVDFIEGGYPLSNPKDAAFFEEAAKLKLDHAKLCAFGMTRRKGVKPADDPGMKALVAANTPVVTIVGKTWDLHVDEVLRISREENLDMIRESVAFITSAGREVFYDAEHFFDGYRANPDYATQTLQAALDGGATRLVLCDTNGGSLPAWVVRAIVELTAKLGLDAMPCSDSPPSQGGARGGSRPQPDCAPSDSVRPTLPQPLPKREGSSPAHPLTPSPAHPREGSSPAHTLTPSPAHPALGIHVHNDGGLAVANSLAAVEAGAVQVQGTINGIGERCGNVDLLSVAANLRLKMNYDCLRGDSMERLTDTSRYVYELANMLPTSGQPFVGSSAFAHKGGMHVHAVQRIAHSYEHIRPEAVGNTRRVLVSELSGVSNIAATLGPKYGIAEDRELQKKVLDRVNALENQGYQFEVATASFELLLHEVMGKLPKLWSLDHYRCVIHKHDSAAAVTEATVKLHVNGRTEHHVAEGDGPVNALDGALRKCLLPHFPQLANVHLRDYRVRVVNPNAESAAKVRVISEFAVRQGESYGDPFCTIGVNENIVDASWQAITDAFVYHLIDRKG